MTYAKAAEALALSFHGELERLIRTCVGRGFHVSCVERCEGHPNGSREHPVIVRGAYDRELARIWIEWPEFSGAVYAMLVMSELAEDVRGAR